MARKIQPEKLKFIVYVRKSTEGAERQVASLKDQKDYANKVVKDNKYKVIARFEESASASKVNNRPEFNKMIKMIGDGEANAIVCWHTNRLSRNPQENGLIQQMLLDGKIKMIHTHDAIHKQGDSIIPLGVEASLNAEYSKKLSEDVTRGILSKNKRGEFNSVAPQGYLNDRDRLTKRPIIVKDPVRFPLIKKMFELYITGKYTVPELLDILNNKWGYRTVRRLKSGGTPLRLASLHNILENPFYMGKIRDMEDPSILRDGAWEPMITEEQYYRIQRMKHKYAIVHNLKPKVKVNTENFQLKGLMVCGCCGCSIVAEAHDRKLRNGKINRHIYYKCTHKSPTRKCTVKGGISEEEAFRQIYEMLDKYTIHPVLYEWSMQILERLHKQEIEERYDIANMQHSTLKNLEEARSKLLDMSLNGMIQGDVYMAKDEELQKKIEKVKQVNKDAQERDKNWYEIVGRALKTLNGAKGQMQSAMEVGERRAILQSIGPAAKLVEREVGTEPNGEVLTAKIIEIEPYPWLDFIEKSSKKLAPELRKVLNSELQGRNDEKSALYKIWWFRLDLNQRHKALQASALPTELQNHIFIIPYL